MIAGPYCCHGTHQRFDPHEIPQGVVLGLQIVYRVLVTVVDADVRSGAGGDSAEVLIPAVPKAARMARAGALSRVRSFGLTAVLTLCRIGAKT